MRTRPGFDPDRNLWDLIAAELRRQRVERGLSLAAVGDLIDRDRSLIARVESGETKLQAAHAIKIDKAWSLGHFFQRLVKFAKAGHDVEWFKTHSDLESRSSELRIWELGWIPGLLQTEGYIRAMFTAAGVEDPEEGVRARLKRQDCLTRKPRPRVWVILDQGVIEQPVGSAGIMREQLNRLIEFAALPNASIRLVPRTAGAHVGRDGSFKIMTVAGADTVYAAAHGGGRLVQDATDIASYRVWFDLIGDVALPKDASRSMLIKTMERFL
ncbi:helix-turn-helix transcriptional regulator [Actinomadura syzygii]|uniref:Helix-turn-helix transcriptional regulator n=1 Tax=Actinomadura syzygii TaxID=1427538 RepID=A0A5D0UAH3_9ACTN|nr:helix-turn-helix transcriptional regulator [Actinomadura syzygii]TYC15348.1 helix-turn-helix transcriptional regulator [Actinomadura syzygii]